VLLAFGWGFLMWGVYLYLWAFVLYLVQVGLVLRRTPKVGELPADPALRRVNGHG
jgi:hypothetical protein